MRKPRVGHRKELDSFVYAVRGPGAEAGHRRRHVVAGLQVCDGRADLKMHIVYRLQSPGTSPVRGGLGLAVPGSGPSGRGSLLVVWIF